MIKNKILILPSFIKNLIFIKKNNKLILTIFFKKKKFILFNSNTLKNLYFNKNTNTIVIKKKNEEIINSNLNNFLLLWKYFLFTKIKFKGKGYKITFNKKKTNINFFFNKSHINILFLKKIILKKIIKNKFILINKNKKKNKDLSKLILSIRKINLYTLRGLRNSKQIIYKRKGKKSSYI